MAEITLREAVNELYSMFGIDRGPGMHPYIQAIGEAANTGTICVYLVRKPRSHERGIPKEWAGYPIETRVIGRMTIGGGG